MTAEEWRPVVGYKGLYEVSDLGRVRSLDRRVSTSKGVRFYPGRLLRPFANGDRHLAVKLSNKSKERRTRLVHRLVLASFQGPPVNGGQCLHRNDIGDDNRLSNLYWGGYSENMRDRVSNGIHHNSRKTHCLRGHEFTKSNTRINTNGSRQCIVCQDLRHCSYKKEM